MNNFIFDGNFIKFNLKKKKKNLFQYVVHKYFLNKFNINLDEYSSFMSNKDTIDTDVFCFFHFFIYTVDHNNCDDNFRKIKFQKINKINNQFFINKNNISTIVDIFGKCQKLYHRMLLFKNLIKWKYSKKFDYNEDLTSTPLNEIKKHHLIEINQNNTIYTFRITDLMKIIETSLYFYNSQVVYCEPKIPCNPFTNIPFNLSNLYAIYFNLKALEFKIPLLFYNYFLLNFDLSKFKIECHIIIREKCITHYINNLTKAEYIKGIRKMMSKKNKFCKVKTQISDDFPNDILIQALGKMYTLYISTIYTENTHKYYINKTKYCKYMRAFYHYNFRFGRRYIKVKKTNTYDTKYIEYDKIEKYIENVMSKDVYEENFFNEFNQVERNILQIPFPLLDEMNNIIASNSNYEYVPRTPSDTPPQSTSRATSPTNIDLSNEVIEEYNEDITVTYNILNDNNESDSDSDSDSNSDNNTINTIINQNINNNYYDSDDENVDSDDENVDSDDEV